MLKARIFGLVLIVQMASLTACAVGPDYKRPKVQVDAKWDGPPATQKSVVETAPAPVAWWNTMNDPTLDSLVQRAWRQNLDVKIARSRIRESRALRDIAVGGLYPTSGANASYGFFRGQGPLFPVNNGDYQLYATSIDAAWELDVFGGVRRSIEAASDDLQAQVDAERGVVVTMVAEVARNYVELRTAQARYAIAKDNVKTEKESLALAERLLDAGLVGQLDVTRAKAQVTTTQAELPILETEEKFAIHQLGILLGESPSALTQELTPMGAIPAPPARVPIGLPSDILRRRPDVRQVERQLASATAQIGVAEADLYPKFTLTGDLGLGAVPPDTIFNWTGRFYGIGPAVRWEIFQGGRILANVDAHKAIRQELIDQYKLTILSAMGDVENSLIAFQRQQDQFDLLRQSVESNQVAVRISNEQYGSGTIGFLSVLDAERSLYETEDQMAVSQGAIDLNMISLYKAVGGGWEAMEAQEKDKSVAGR